MPSWSVSPGFFWPITDRSCSTVATGTPSALTMMSPPSGHVSPATVTCCFAPRSPAFAAPVDEHTVPTSRPLFTGRRNSRATAPAAAGDRASVDAEERMLHDPLRDQLRRDALDGVDRDGEADADVAVAAARGLDLRVDADHLAAAVEERAAGVAVVEGGVRLDDVVDRRAVRRHDLPLERADDARRDRPVLAERVADRHDRIADLDEIGVAEPERRERARV